MIAPSSADRSCVRLFLSVDLVGSTAFKNRREDETKRTERRGPPWADVFSSFYNGFPKMFERELDGQSLEADVRPRLVKPIGDELLLQAPIQRSRDARDIVRFTAKALVEYRKRNLSDCPLLIKGAAWIAGFPINNYRVMLEEWGGHAGGEDFIGPSMDTGFRLAHEAAAPEKLVVSVDLAVLLLASDTPLDLYFDGTITLKGVLSGRPYPIVWYKVAGLDTKLHDAELKLRAHRPLKDELRRYCDEYLRSCQGTWLIRPYFEDDPEFREKPAWHENVLRTWGKIDERNLSTGPEAPGRRSAREKRARRTRGGEPRS